MSVTLWCDPQQTDILMRKTNRMINLTFIVARNRIAALAGDGNGTSAEVMVIGFLIRLPDLEQGSIISPHFHKAVHGY